MNLQFIKIEESNKEILSKIELRPNQIGLADCPLEAYELAKKFTYAYPTAIFWENAAIAFLIYEALNEMQTHFLVWDFVVDKAFQGQGYGREIMMQLMQKLRIEYHAEKIELAYEPSNHIARNLYRSLGFLESGKINDDGEIEMELLLH